MFRYNNRKYTAETLKIKKIRNMCCVWRIVNSISSYYLKNNGKESLQ
jgi:hypothetical protein